MTTPIAQPAKREHVELPDAASLAQAAFASQASSVAEAATAQHAIAAKAPGLDPLDFVRDHRINIKHGSLFVDPYLVLHPREFRPENEAKLREKLKLTYSVNNPSFYESYDRLMIALGLGRLIPPSVQARESRLLDEHKKIEAQKQGGESDARKLFESHKHPFEAIVRETVEKPRQDPVGIESLKNGLTLYLLLREKLTALGYRDKLASYVMRNNTTERVLGDLGGLVGVTPLQLREAALKGGIEGVGQLLGLDPVYVADARRVVEYAATQDFGFNLIEHWHMGRQLLGVAAPMEQKIARGLEARVARDFEKFKTKMHELHPTLDVPAHIKSEEKRVAQKLNLLEPVQRLLMHKLGYEICYTPEFLADEIAGYPGIYGLHRKAAKDLHDTRATYRIYFSGRNDLEGSDCTLVHEVAHNLWPQQFSLEEQKKIDTLAASDAQRFLNLHRLLGERFEEFDKFLRAYQAGSGTEKAAIAQTTKQHFAAYGVSIDEGVLANLRNANELRYLVSYAVDRLRIEGDFYAKSGYESAAERMREVISRFAELKQVKLSGSPRLMQFLAPGLNQVWENHYMPHLTRMHQQLELSEKTAAEAIERAKAGANVADAVVATAETPKVENRPVDKPAPPATKSEVDVCAADAAPGTKVFAPSIDSSVMSVLNGMHIQPSR